MEDRFIILGTLGDQIQLIQRNPRCIKPHIRGIYEHSEHIRRIFSLAVNRREGFIGNHIIHVFYHIIDRGNFVHAVFLQQV
ncbi:hypothetical protein D3C81_2072500 [compost metagenome]